MGKIQAAFTALKAGEQLSQPGTWKNRQMLMNALLVVIGGVLELSDIQYDGRDVEGLAYILSTVGFALNNYFTAATSKKVGAI